MPDPSQHRGGGEPAPSLGYLRKLLEGAPGTEEPLDQARQQHERAMTAASANEQLDPSSHEAAATICADTAADLREVREIERQLQEMKRKKLELLGVAARAAELARQMESEDQGTRAVARLEGSIEQFRESGDMNADNRHVPREARKMLYDIVQWGNWAYQYEDDGDLRDTIEYFLGEMPDHMRAIFEEYGSVDEIIAIMRERGREPAVIDVADIAEVGPLLSAAPSGPRRKEVRLRGGRLFGVDANDGHFRPADLPQLDQVETVLQRQVNVFDDEDEPEDEEDRSWRERKEMENQLIADCIAALKNGATPLEAVAQSNGALSLQYRKLDGPVEGSGPDRHKHWAHETWGWSFQFKIDHPRPSPERDKWIAIHITWEEGREAKPSHALVDLP